jgi:trimethylamine--corrinoid protein Co-methyltransferase
MVKPVLRFFSDEEVRRIKDEAMGLLAKMGVEVDHEKARNMLLDVGAKVEPQTKKILIPPELSEKYHKTLPRQVVWGGRTPTDDILVGGGGRRLTRTLSGAEGYIDLESGKYRKARLADVKDWAVLVEGLNQLDAATVPFYFGRGVNMAARDVRGLEILWEHTRKHTTTGTYGKKNVEYLIEMMKVERGSVDEVKKRPRFSAHISPVPPLQYHENSVEMILLCGEYGIPVLLIPMPTRGISAPVTIAGTVLMTMAETLAGVVISQVAHPGAPVCYAGRPTDTDLRSGSPLMGSIENSVLWGACVQVAKEGFGWLTDAMGPSSDSFLPDEQTLIERSFSTTFPSLAGADILTGAGGFETSVALDPVLLVLDNEFHGMLRWAEQGIEVSDDSLGLKAIARVGVGHGKNFLLDKHTLKYMRTEIYQPMICTRSTRAAWEERGEKDLYQKAKEKAVSILEGHKLKPLDDGVVKEMRRIAEIAQNEITSVSTA